MIIRILKKLFVLLHILTAESEVEIDFNTSKKQENSYKSSKQKEKRKSLFEEPSLPSWPSWEPPKLPDSNSVYIFNYFLSHL